MSLASLLSAEQIIPEMKATERWSAIVELIDLLVGLGKIKTEDRESILASLKQREETMSTGIGFGIAIPHASSDRIEEVVASFGRSSQGIEFDALDNAPGEIRRAFHRAEESISNPPAHSRFDRKVFERPKRSRKPRHRSVGRRDSRDLSRPFAKINGSRPAQSGRIIARTNWRSGSCRTAATK